MLEIGPYINTWQPEPEALGFSNNIIFSKFNCKSGFFFIAREMPYIEAYYLLDSCATRYCHRFVFHEHYRWSYEEEQLFEICCLKNTNLRFDSAALNRIFDYYSGLYPEWHLKRYYTHDMRMLDHIYHCFRQNSAKEILYKADLDTLAEFVTDIDELNLLSGRPSEIYDGITLRTLRALNCQEGAALLSLKSYRCYLLELQKYFPDLFRQKLNDAQCKYLKRLIDGGLVPGETGRLFQARRLELMMIWNDYMYYIFLAKEKNMDEYRRVKAALATVDPIYKKYFDSLKSDAACITSAYRDLQIYLLVKREEYDRQMRRINRKHDPTWQERDHGYVVRYPQTINDFCRESIYMGNCLLAFAEAVLCNDTTVLFIRKVTDVNHPFITVEIQNNCLMQAYHRFNQDCTEEEASWIRAYCQRHGIQTHRFHFNRELDQLY